MVQLGPDGDGYSYKLSICSDITTADLPTGCSPSSGGTAEHPAVVKYKAQDPSDCTQIGSFGPCTGVNAKCGMTGVKTATGVNVTYAYEYGVTFTFTLLLTSGSAATPGAVVTSNEMDYWAPWAGLSGVGLAGAATSIGVWALVTIVVVMNVLEMLVSLTDPPCCKVLASFQIRFAI